MIDIWHMKYNKLCMIYVIYMEPNEITNMIARGKHFFFLQINNELRNDQSSEKKRSLIVK